VEFVLQGGTTLKYRFQETWELLTWAGHSYVNLTAYLLLHFAGAWMTSVTSDNLSVVSVKCRWFSRRCITFYVLTFQLIIIIIIIIINIVIVIVIINVTAWIFYSGPVLDICMRILRV
jgi:hypothetical protein